MKTVLLANRADEASSREVTADKGRSVAAKLGAGYFEVSAKSGAGVLAALEALIESIYKRS